VAALGLEPRSGGAGDRPGLMSFFYIL